MQPAVLNVVLCLVLTEPQQHLYKHWRNQVDGVKRGYRSISPVWEYGELFEIWFSNEICAFQWILAGWRSCI